MATLIPAPRVPLVDPRTGLVSRDWLTFLMRTGSGSDTAEYLAPLVATLILQVAEMQVELAALSARPATETDARDRLANLELEILQPTRSAREAEMVRRIADLETEVAALRDDPWVSRKPILSEP